MKISVVVPVYNEERRIAATLRHIFNYLNHKQIEFEIIVVDDGSFDQTSVLIQKTLPDFGNLQTISYNQNRGKGYAVKTGMLAAKGEFVLFCDADSSTPIEELENFLPYLNQGFHVIIGSRKMPGAHIEIKQSFCRRFMGKCFSELTNLILCTNISDITCGFKLFSKEVVGNVFTRQLSEGWSFDSEILFIIRRLGYRIKEVPVRWRNSPDTKVRLLRDTISSICGLIKIKINYWLGKYNMNMQITSIPDVFTTRAFYIQHLAPYEYVRRMAKGKIILDAGTSDGYGAYYLSETAKEVIAVDIEPAAIKKAQGLYGGKRNNLKFLTNNILNMTFLEGYFDMIISSQVVEHISLDGLDKYLSEIYRVLKKDGIFFISTLNLTNNLKGRSEKDYDKCPYHVKEFTAVELEKFLLTRFPEVEILGLHRGARHAFYAAFKKSGIFKMIPAKFNPVKRFYENAINIDDFVYSGCNMGSSFDLMGICRK